jgi:hypothetical protein
LNLNIRLEPNDTKAITGFFLEQLHYQSASPLHHSHRDNNYITRY